jgi:hypothetical protein
MCVLLSCWSRFLIKFVSSALGPCTELIAVRSSRWNAPARFFSHSDSQVKEQFLLAWRAERTAGASVLPPAQFPRCCAVYYFIALLLPICLSARFCCSLVRSVLQSARRVFELSVSSVLTFWPSVLRCLIRLVFISAAE